MIKPKDSQAGTHEHIYFAIDSDVLRVLTALNMKMKGQKPTEQFPPKQLEQLIPIFEAVKKDEVRLLIVPTVYAENEDNKQRREFMKEWCYFPNRTNNKERDSLEKNGRKLAYKYTKSYRLKGVLYPAPMIAKYVAEIGKRVPPNDAFIMAEATVENCFVLTFNAKDFTKVKSRQDLGNARSKGIVEINTQAKYSQIIYGYYKVVPKPVTPETVSACIAKSGIKSFIASVSRDADRIKCDRVL